MIHALAAAIRASQQLVVFTGAGISTESGIPDFRSPGGVWSRYQPVTIQEFAASHAARRRYWQYKREAYPGIASAQPNAGHLALVELEQRGNLQALITQNIDGLHSRAGNSPELILELHGSELWVTCLQCGTGFDRDDVQRRLDAGEDVPGCSRCGGLLKPATVSFGQALPGDVLDAAFAHAHRCRAFLVIGSSLVVQPAAMLPQSAKQAGAWLGILNRDRTPLDEVADWVCHEPAGPTLQAAVDLLSSREHGCSTCCRRS